jgi:hypothetical protein
MRNMRRLSVLLTAVIVITISMLNVGSAGAAASVGEVEEVVNANSAYCMTVLGDAVANGSKVYQAQCKGAPGQRWERITVDADNSRYNFYNPNSQKCLDTSWNRDRAQLYIWTCNRPLPSDNVNQIFYVLASGSYVTIRPTWSTRKCVGVAGGSLMSHIAIVFATCDGSYGQKWYFWRI